MFSQGTAYLSFPSMHESDREQTFLGGYATMKSHCYWLAFTERLISFSHAHVYIVNHSKALQGVSSTTPDIWKKPPSFQKYGSKPRIQNPL